MFAVWLWLRSGMAYRRIWTPKGQRLWRAVLTRILLPGRAATLVFGKSFANEILISHIAVERSCEKTEKLLRLKNKPFTLLPMSGPTTTGVIKAISDREMSIPHVISVIGFDKFEYASLLPPLTTIGQPAAEFGIQAVHIEPAEEYEFLSRVSKTLYICLASSSHRSFSSTSLENDTILCSSDIPRVFLWEIQELS